MSNELIKTTGDAAEMKNMFFFETLTFSWRRRKQMKLNVKNGEKWNERLFIKINDDKFNKTKNEDVKDTSDSVCLLNYCSYGKINI